MERSCETLLGPRARRERKRERGTGSKTGKEGGTERKGKIWREWVVKSTLYYNTGIANIK